MKAIKRKKGEINAALLCEDRKIDIQIAQPPEELPQDEIYIVAEEIRKEDQSNYQPFEDTAVATCVPRVPQTDYVLMCV